MTTEDLFDLPPLCPVHAVKPQYAAAPEHCIGVAGCGR
jgi:hypothetical protein